MKIGGSGAVYALLLGLALLSPTSSVRSAAPVLSPPTDAGRLPTFCRYEVDVHDDPAAHAKLLKATDVDAVTCPFVDRTHDTVRVYQLRQGRTCSPQDLPGLTVISVREISGREKRSQQKCFPLAIGERPTEAQLGGKQFLVREPADSMVGDITQTSTIYRSGAPIVQLGGGTTSNIVGGGFRAATTYSCFLMLPGANVDPMTYFRSLGLPFGAAAVQEEITGENCNAAIRTRYGVDFSDLDTGPAQSQMREFPFWLMSTSDTPNQVTFVRRIRALLRSDGLRPERAHGRITWVVGKRLVSKMSDGAALAFTGGSRQTMIELRAFTPESCKVIYDVAKRLSLSIQTWPDLMDVNPVGVAARKPAHGYKQVQVRSASDLCDLVRPGFEEWKADGPTLPDDLRDLDVADYSIVS
ncbi:MAG TPA: hypothetical protein VGL66_17125 [Caulobacteraceae bacterium]